MQRRFPWKLFWRSVALQSGLLIAALAVTGVAARHYFKSQFLGQVEHQLGTTLKSLSRALPGAAPRGWCSTYSSEAELRLTLVDPEGRVLCDSHHDPATMQNHASRPEIREAGVSGFGASVRFSDTIHENMLYGALRLDGDGRVLRGAIPLAALVKTLRVFDASLVALLLLVLVGAVLFAVWSGRSLALPIGRILEKAERVAAERPGEAEDDHHEEAFGELSELESSLEKIRRDLETKNESLNREREEQAALMSAISDGILAVDAEGAPLFYNSRFAVLFGSEGLGQGRGRLWETFRDPEILGAFRSALKEGLPSIVNAMPMEGEAGKRFFSVSVAPLAHAQGDVYGAVGVFHDVTELKRAEQIRIDFVANVSHELRTPLTAIKGYADTIKLDVEGGRPVSKDYVDVIDRNTDRLMHLINDLLDLSSLESSAESLARQDVPTDDATARVLKQLEGTARAKRQTIEVREGGARSVYADPRRLEQILVNLLDNAIKYTPAGGKITVAWQPSAGGAVTLRVSDSGPGIPREHHARLFERFYRVDKARSRELGGTGLGLAIVKHIMQRHGGRIGVESQVGRGSSFVCEFPGARGEA